MVGEACLPSNAYYPRTPDYTLCSGVHVCWSEHSDSSFVYGFMILNYCFGTMTATTCTPRNNSNASMVTCSHQSSRVAGRPNIESIVAQLADVQGAYYQGQQIHDT